MAVLPTTFTPRAMCVCRNTFSDVLWPNKGWHAAEWSVGFRRCHSPHQEEPQHCGISRITAEPAPELRAYCLDACVCFILTPRTVKKSQGDFKDATSLDIFEKKGRLWAGRGWEGTERNVLSCSQRCSGRNNKKITECHNEQPLSVSDAASQVDPHSLCADLHPHGVHNHGAPRRTAASPRHVPGTSRFLLRLTSGLSLIIQVPPCSTRVRNDLPNLHGLSRTHDLDSVRTCSQNNCPD